MICIDCSGTFYGNDHKGHVSCISEQEKHWGEFANKGKKTKGIEKPAKPVGKVEVQGDGNVKSHDNTHKSENNKAHTKKQAKPDT